MNPRQLRNDICNWLQQMWGKNLGMPNKAMTAVVLRRSPSKCFAIYYPQKLVPILLLNPSIEPPP